DEPWQVIYPMDFTGAPALVDTDSFDISVDGTNLTTVTETNAIICSAGQVWISPHMGGATGGFGATPDACAGCHRAHTAKGAYLLTVDSSRTNFCYSCHESGTGAYTDVANGMYLGDYDPIGGAAMGLRGGGFDYALMDTDVDGTTELSAVTSLHNTSADGTLWGFDPANEAVGPTVAFECTSCHNPHGNASYRILRPKPAVRFGLTNGVEVSASYNQWLWGKAIEAADLIGPIDIEDVDGYANGPNAVDYAFNDKSSAINADWSLATSTVTFTELEESVQAPKTAEPVELEIRVAEANGTVGALSVDVNNGAWAIGVGTVTPTGSFATTTIDVSAQFTSLAELNAAQVRLVGTGTGVADLLIDEVRLNVIYDDGYNDEVADKKYTIEYHSGTDPDPRSQNTRIVSYSPKLINAWCAQCHNAYLGGVDAGSTDYSTTNANFAYRHMTGSLTEGWELGVDPIIPDENVGFSQGCLKCHVAHGTSAAMGTYSNTVPWPGDDPIGDSHTTSRSSLLHIDNRGVCTQCHSSDNLANN
ncbi:MAG: cytochrome c3 family protein, partial [Chloroflexota bacterium]|nr:cytochrome c3 family protein [Chloroflexota bacterium]